jgi:hypothetical protein
MDNIEKIDEILSRIKKLKKDLEDLENETPRMGNSKMTILEKIRNNQYLRGKENTPGIEDFYKKIENLLLHETDERKIRKFFISLEDIVVESPWDGGYMDPFVFSDYFDEMKKVLDKDYKDFDELMDDRNASVYVTYDVFVPFIMNHRELIDDEFILSVINYIIDSAGDLSDCDYLFE